MDPSGLAAVRPAAGRHRSANLPRRGSRARAGRPGLQQRPAGPAPAWRSRCHAGTAHHPGAHHLQQDRLFHLQGGAAGRHLRRLHRGGEAAQRAVAQAKEPQAPSQAAPGLHPGSARGPAGSPHRRQGRHRRRQPHHHRAAQTAGGALYRSSARERAGTAHLGTGLSQGGERRRSGRPTDLRAPLLQLLREPHGLQPGPQGGGRTACRHPARPGGAGR
ncbi:hypothetical protein WP7S18E06_23300 [Aeromonas hydrophila]|nr:hypothetical protein WP7S18E06_23300 [Aeromonas hydrophila]